MRPFPKCGPTRYPDLEGWGPYKTGLGLRAAPKVRAQDVAVLRQVLDREVVPDDWANGCPADVLLFTELVDGTGAMPGDLLKLLPRQSKEMGVLLTQVPIGHGSAFATIRIRIYGSKVVLFCARREHVWVNLWPTSRLK